jgi:predicted acyltransferase
MHIPPASAQSESPGRIDSLDQFRGYTVLGMFLVNFVGSFGACHFVLRHHNTFVSYADTIMPQFFFAVGFAFRLTFGRRVQRDGSAVAYARFVRRLLGLILIALVVYTVNRPADSWEQLRGMTWLEIFGEALKRDWFQTLMHIAVTSLWILPVIHRSARIRLAFLLSSAAIHVCLSHVFYFGWVTNGNPNGVDGGPLGFLTWTIPTLAGSFACDWVTGLTRRGCVVRLLGWSLTLMLAGYLLSCGTRFYDIDEQQRMEGSVAKVAERPVLPNQQQRVNWRSRLEARGASEILTEAPFVPPPHPDGRLGDSYLFRQWNYWMMSQRGGTLSYLTFSAGFSMAVYLLFLLACDFAGWRLGVFRTFGTNALAGYVLHMLVDAAITPFVPRDSPAWYMWSMCALYMLIVYVLVRSLEKSNIYLRV